MIIAFEGIDGAGKNTCVTALEAELLSREIPVAKLAFPRYEQSVHAQLASAALHGGMGDLVDSVHGMATLFALDRAEVAGELADFDDEGYVVLLDRYVASNAAYSAARLGVGEADVVDSEVVAWVDELEFDGLGAPVPDVQILVDVPDEVASGRVAGRAEQDADRAADAYERDGDLQSRTLAAYRALAAAQWRSPWWTLDNSGDPADLQQAVSDLVDGLVEDPSTDG
ncbi:MAG: dTMP kinase [Corynebacterium sp.]|uniref:dTMP kinase n=1 Tax=Corynebacterium sp. TaxID=1720 RepID=UPI0026493D7E|nr:dTMP kinase [Corynebacterium sp.]MDN5581676.1 dTMP kinase [Corynebacterium sp.]MDN5720596.1 dTMP kinase [Corynebacterium sp.]MDN6324498.1 dTMP kinase [Corynebacterium sp.]MDN6511362.1 dTMP kinase [Corynebacterium sp.]